MVGMGRGRGLGGGGEGGGVLLFSLLFDILLSVVWCLWLLFCFA